MAAMVIAAVLCGGRRPVERGLGTRHGGVAAFSLPAGFTAPQTAAPAGVAGSGTVNWMPFAFFAAGPLSKLIATFFKIGLGLLAADFCARARSPQPSVTQLRAG